nr:EcsC family protein [Chromobacterium sp. ASV5]
MTENIKAKMADKINEGLGEAFDAVYNERKKHYEIPSNTPPELSNLSKLVSNYSMVNAGISGAAGLAPGPWGMLAVVPEIIAVTRNQIAMVYDIGAAYGHEQKINRELLMAVFAAAAGGGTIGLLTIRGGQLIVRRASLRVIQRIINILGGKITQQALKATFAKWVPLAGAAGMAYWSKYSTEQIAKKAHEIFSMPITVSDEELEDCVSVGG